MRRAVTVGIAILVLGFVPPLAADSAEQRLWTAAREGDLATVKALLAAGVDVNARTEFDCTALYFATNANHTEVMKVLIEAGANVDVADNSYGYTAIGMAGWLGHTEAVELLIDSGVDRGSAVGAFFAAVSTGRPRTVKAMLAKLEIPQAQKDSALATALQAGAEEVAAVLRKAGAKAPETPEAKAQEPSRSAEEDKPRAEPGFDLSLDRPVRVARAANWPEFRGAGRSGIADGQHPPIAFQVEQGRNLAWRVRIDGLGYSSPVVWGDKVFVTTAVAPTAAQTIEDEGRGWIDAVAERDVPHEWQLRAYSLSSGDLLWKRTVKRGRPISERHWKASQANPTCATDGRVVLAFFGSEGLYAYDLDGNKLWERQLGELNAGWYIDAKFEWGFASSPTLFDDRVIVQADVHGQSFVAAFSLKDGKQLWRTSRDEIPAWGTPLVYRGKQRSELVLNASKSIVGYDPRNGKELWRIRGNSPITVASPIAQDGMIVATGGYRTPKPVYVVKPGANGDVTPEEGKKHPAFYWSSQTDGVYIVTPLLYRGILYLCRGNGVLTAWDAKNGKQHYKQRLGSSYTASPVAADGRIYFTGEDGTVTVIEAGDEFQVLARSELPAPALATPAISNGKLLFRTVAELIAVGFPARAAVAKRPDR